jgi:hypothetical protein
MALAPGYFCLTAAIALWVDIPLGGKKSNASPIGCDPVFVVVKPCALNKSWCFCVLNPLVGLKPNAPKSFMGLMLLPLKVARRQFPSDLLPHFLYILYR